MKPVALLPALFFALLPLAPLPAPAGEGEVPLDLDLPRPLFEGTPVPVKLPNLEPPRQGKRPPLMVPPGLVNLAKGKPVTSSDMEPVIGDLAQVTDGDKTGEEGGYVELGPGPQWVSIDLGAPSEIHAIAVWHYHAQARAYTDVVVQIADDPDFITGVQILFNSDDDNSSGFGAGKDPAYIETYEGRLIPAKGAKGRYVRLSSNGNTANRMNHYVEVEVWGRPH